MSLGKIRVWAMGLVLEHQQAIRTVAGELTAKRRLTAEEIHALMGGQSPGNGPPVR